MFYFMFVKKNFKFGFLQWRDLDGVLLLSHLRLCFEQTDSRFCRLAPQTFHSGVLLMVRSFVQFLILMSLGCCFQDFTVSLILIVLGCCFEVEGIAQVQVQEGHSD